jgi:hypothetical protein
MVGLRRRPGRKVLAKRGALWCNTRVRQWFLTNGFTCTEGNHMSRMGASSSAPPVGSTKQLQEKIAQRAYEKWVQRGRPHGDGVQDWLDAEKEVKQELDGTPSTPTSHRRHS